MRSPVVIGVAVALVLTLAFWFLLYRPADERQDAVEAEIVTLQAEQDSLRNQIRQLEDVKAREVEIRAAQARLEEFIPVGPAQPSAIRQFQRAADQAGADIASVSFGEPAVPDAASGAAPTDTGTPGTTLANIPVSMVVEGGYFQAVDFFRRLEVEMPRAVLVESVDIAAAEGGFPRLSVRWSGQIFAVVEASDVTDTTTAPGTPDASATESPSPSPEGGGS